MKKFSESVANINKVAELNWRLVVENKDTIIKRVEFIKKEYNQQITDLLNELNSVKDFLLARLVKINTFTKPDASCWGFILPADMDLSSRTNEFHTNEIRIGPEGFSYNETHCHYVEDLLDFDDAKNNDPVVNLNNLRNSIKDIYSRCQTNDEHVRLLRSDINAFLKNCMARPVNDFDKIISINRELADNIRKITPTWDAHGRGDNLTMRNNLERFLVGENIPTI